MSDVPAVGSDASISTEALVLEELTETQVKGLVEEAKTAIKQKDFDRASQIITQLSQVHYKAQAPKGWIDTIRGYFSGSQGPVSMGNLFDLFSDLCKENHEEGKKLIPVLSKNFSIETDGYYYKIAGSGFSGSFNIPIKTDVEAQALIDHIYKLTSEREFEDLERELPRLAELCADKRVAMDDFTKLYIDLVFANSSFAVKCMPIFKLSYLMEVSGDCLIIRDIKSNNVLSTFTSHIFSLLDCDSALKRIAAKEKPMERFNDYLLLAKHQLERAPEVMTKAEGELNQMGDPWAQVSAQLSMVVCYQRNHDEKNFIRMASMLERELACAEESEKKYFYLAKLSVFRALISLKKGDRDEYNNWILTVAQEMKHVKEAKKLESLQRDLNFLKSKGEEMFTLDQVELHARKV